MASQPIYQFYAELPDYEPKIWRRFQVPGNITLARLGYVVMTLYEMKGGHLFQFMSPGFYNNSVLSRTFGKEDNDSDEKGYALYGLKTEEFMDEDEDTQVTVVSVTTRANNGNGRPTH